MKLKEISLKDKKVFDKFLKLQRHCLSVYAFGNIFIWKGLFKVYWGIIAGSLCVFFKDKTGCFLYLPPLAGRENKEAVYEAFKVMEAENKNKSVSRIENIEESAVDFYKGLGFDVIPKFSEYVCDRVELAGLRGNRFKSKRACVNFFEKNYRYEYLPFSLRHSAGCLKLYLDWMRQRRAASNDAVYQWMLEDSLVCFKILLKNYKYLDSVARVVKIKDKIKGFTCGFEINAETFCVQFEVTDLAVKGLSQFIFRRFCEESEAYKYISIMDDSGLENLKKVKLSYHPARLMPSYIVRGR